ncbi:MAG TPA: VCBS repeat-containing protein, partial [Planctomycetota bacterium]|nr:VCBS repeat-containing protein [Planctomycetota bacterium]
GFSIESHWASAGLAAGDLDGDGAPDLVLSQTFKSTTDQRGRILVLYGDPAIAGRVGARVVLQCGLNPLDLVMTDLDGNGLLDLATADAGDGTVTLLLQTAPSVFIRSVVAATARPRRLAAGDLNQDGLTDLAVVGARDVVVLFQDSGAPGAFLPGTVAIPDADANCLALADADGAGGLDIVLGLQRDIAIALQDAGAPGTFLAVQAFPVQARGVDALATADLDGDGGADFAYVSNGIWPSFSGAVTGVLLHTPGGGFAYTDTVVRRGTPQTTVVIADMDNDGIDDLLVGGRVGIAWYRQDPLAPGEFDRVAGREFNAAEGPLAVVDLDGDGFLDPVASFFDSYYAPRKPQNTDKFLKPRRFREP